MSESRLSFAPDGPSPGVTIPNPSSQPTAGRSPAAAELAELAEVSGLRRVHFLQWRDLDDVEAGGSEIHAAKIAAIWAEAGVEVVMRSSYAQGHPPEAVRDGYRVIRRRGRYMIFPAAVIAELRGLHGPRDGLVEIWNGVPFLSPLWARGPKVTFIHHVHREMWKMVLEERLAEVGVALESRVAPPLYRRVPIITLSESSRRELVDSLHFRSDRVHVVHPGIDERFVPGPAKSPTPLMVAAGRLMPTKRFDVLMTLAAAARDRVPGLELVIIGDGYDRAKLEDLIDDLDARDWIRLAGHVSDDELLGLYQQAWVVASASIAEGWGMTLTEAAACGTPSVATDITGHRDAVAAGRSGLLAATDDQFVEHLVSVLTDADLRQRLSDGALKHAGTLTWDATAIGVFQVLADDAMRRRRRRGSVTRP